MIDPQLYKLSLAFIGMVGTYYGWLFLLLPIGLMLLR